MTIRRRDFTCGLTCRSDAGCQFTNYRTTERHAIAGKVAPIGSVGDSYDNAMAEALNSTYKADLIRRRWRRKTRKQAEFATIEWIDWNHTTSLHGEIGRTPPLERDSIPHALDTPAIMAVKHLT